MYLSIFCDDCNNVMDMMAEKGIKADFAITSPPYDNLRSYQGVGDEWNFDIFKKTAEKLHTTMREGCCLVWICNDATINGSETGTSFRQALYFKEVGFKLLDTMIWEKDTSSFPARPDSRRYSQIFEYMFVFCKGKPRADYTLLRDKPNKWYGHTNFGQQSQRNQKGDIYNSKKKHIDPVPQFSLRNNIWLQNNVSKDGDKEYRHNAAFPVQLIKDHILSWSVEGDTVFDPFGGGFTTGVACIETNRNFIGCEIIKDYYENMGKPRLIKHLNENYELIEGEFGGWKKR